MRASGAERVLDSYRHDTVNILGSGCGAAAAAAACPPPFKLLLPQLILPLSRLHFARAALLCCRSFYYCLILYYSGVSSVICSFLLVHYRNY